MAEIDGVAAEQLGVPVGEIGEDGLCHFVTVPDGQCRRGCRDGASGVGTGGVGTGGVGTGGVGTHTPARALCVPHSGQSRRGRPEPDAFSLTAG